MSISSDSTEPLVQFSSVLEATTFETKSTKTRKSQASLVFS